MKKDYKELFQNEISWGFRCNPKCSSEIFIRFAEIEQLYQSWKDLLNTTIMQRLDINDLTVSQRELLPNNINTELIFKLKLSVQDYVIGYLDNWGAFVIIGP